MNDPARAARGVPAEGAVRAIRRKQIGARTNYVFGQDSNLLKFTVEQLRGDSGLEFVVAYTAWQNPASEDIKLAVEISHDLSTWLPLNINKTNLMESGRIECVWLHQVNANEHLVTFYRLQIVRR